ncbi:MAG: FAD binding domain-containing protein [Thaumarchaeota archaeon]|nr:FAD binding domain-containing protein [Nitrososphaerota archaeon]
MFNPIELRKPSTLLEAVSDLATYGFDARIIAGNTALYELAAQGGLDDVHILIDSSRLGLDYIRSGTDGRLHVGATTTFSQLAKNKHCLQGRNAALGEAASRISPPQIRNMGTIGGSISIGLPFLDMPVTLLALDAEINVMSKDGRKTIKIDDFFVDYFTTALNPEDLITEIVFPEEDGSSEKKEEERGGNSQRSVGFSAFIKIGRTTVDFAVINCAVCLEIERHESKSKSPLVEKARVALGCVGNKPIRRRDIEALLENSELNRATIESAALLPVDFEPSPSIHASPSYKKKMITVSVREALYTLLDRMNSATPIS